MAKKRKRKSMGTVNVDGREFPIVDIRSEGRTARVAIEETVPFPGAGTVKIEGVLEFEATPLVAAYLVPEKAGEN